MDKEKSAVPTEAVVENDIEMASGEEKEKPELAPPKETEGEVLEKEERRAFDLFQCLPYGHAYGLPGKPPAHREQHTGAWVFIANHNNISIHRDNGEADLIEVYENGGKHRLSPESGWRGEHERSSFFKILEIDGAVYGLPEEEQASVRSEEDEKADRSFLEVLRCPPRTPPMAQATCSVEPDSERGPRANGQSLFYVKMDKVMVCRYYGKVVHKLEHVTGRAEHLVLYRWREGSPAPMWGFESFAERSHFLRWIAWMARDMKDEANGVPANMRTKQPSELPPPVKPFEYPSYMLEEVTKVAASYQALKELPVPPFGRIDKGIPNLWMDNGEGYIVPPAYGEGYEPTGFDFALLQYQLTVQQKEMNRLREAVSKIFKEPEAYSSPDSASASSSASKRGFAPRRGSNAKPRNLFRTAPGPIQKRDHSSFSGEDKRVGKLTRQVEQPVQQKPARSSGHSYFKGQVSATIEQFDPATGQRILIVMQRTKEQEGCLNTLWVYQLGGMTGTTKVPHMYKDFDTSLAPNYYDIDMPRKRRNTKLEDHPGPDKDFEKPELDLGRTLVKCQFDPDYRTLELSWVRESFFKYYENHKFPHAALKNLPFGGQRYRDRENGRNDGNDCNLCFGTHFFLWCFVFPLASQRRRLLSLRGACLSCRGFCGAGQEDAAACPAGGRYNCGNKECIKNNEIHHKEVCSRTDLDLERQQYHKDE